MNWRLLNPFNEDFGMHTPIRMQRAEHLILIYWAIALVLGVPFLYDWLLSWTVPQTWSNPWLLTLLLGTLLISQVLYIIVSHPDGRPIHWGSVWIFGVCNGIAETLTFALVFRIGMLAGGWLTSLIVPAWASYGSFAIGLLFFVVYGGLIHGLFWIRLLPPHFHDDPLSVRIRRLRPLSETLLVLGWSLCWWLYADFWTVVFCHTIIDLTLMLQVRPPLFQRRPSDAEEPVLVEVAASNGSGLPMPEAALVPADHAWPVEALARNPVLANTISGVAPTSIVGPGGVPLRRVYGLNGMVSDDTLRVWKIASGLLGYSAIMLLDYVVDQAMRDSEPIND